MIYFFCFAISLILFSCDSNKSNSNIIASGEYYGKMILFLELSKTFPGEVDTKTVEEVTAFVDFTGDQPFINIDGSNLIVCGIKEFKDKLSFNIKEQKFMKNMEVHGSSGIIDSDGNKYDGMFNLTSKKITFGVEGTYLYQKGNSPKINTPIVIAFELNKL